MDSQKLDEFLNRHKFPLAMGVVGVVLLIGGIISSGIIPKTFIRSSKSFSPQSLTQTKQAGAKVDVSGAVVNPGVYTLPGEARIEDALKAAGGVVESADPIHLSKSVNLAQKVSDGMKIYIPKAQEAGASAISPASPGIQATGNTPVNINAAAASELDQLPGIGPVTSQKIIDNRPYGGIEELLTKKAVSRSVYEKIKDKVSVW